MAREIRVVITCDGNGSPCNNPVPDDTEPAMFAYGDVLYARDLCTDHLLEFQSLMAMLIASSTQASEVPGVGLPIRPTRAKTGNTAKNPYRRVGRPRGPQAKSVCPECKKILASVTLTRHIERFHPNLWRNDAAMDAVRSQVAADTANFKNQKAEVET